MSDDENGGARRERFPGENIRVIEDVTSPYPPRTIEMKPVPPPDLYESWAKERDRRYQAVKELLVEDPALQRAAPPLPEPRVADLPAKWRADYQRCWADRSALPDAITCGMQLEQALAREPHVTITGEALQLTALLRESEAHCAELLATVENLRKANSELASAAIAPDPKSVDALRLAVKMVTGDEHFFFTRDGGGSTVEDLRDYLWQKLCAPVASDNALKQAIHLLVGEYPRVTYKEEVMEVSASVSTGHGRSVACVDTMPHHALLRLIGVLAVGAVR